MGARLLRPAIGPVIIRAGAWTNSPPILYVEDGTLTLSVDGPRSLLPAGTAGVFAGDRAHAYG
jgi:hypothetical protein